jgi:hypothetical protein
MKRREEEEEEEPLVVVVSEERDGLISRGPNLTKQPENSEDLPSLSYQMRLVQATNTKRDRSQLTSSIY